MATTALDLEVRATVENVRAVRRTVAETAAEAGFPARVVDELRLCVTEAVANAVLHAYGAADGVVEVRVEVDGDALVLTVRDEGRGIEHARGTSGGHGLRLMREVSDEFSITSLPFAGTVVRMSFHRGSGSHRSLEAALSARAARPPGGS